MNPRVDCKRFGGPAASRYSLWPDPAVRYQHVESGLDFFVFEEPAPMLPPHLSDFDLYQPFLFDPFRDSVGTDVSSGFTECRKDAAPHGNRYSSRSVVARVRESSSTVLGSSVSPTAPVSPGATQGTTAPATPEPSRDGPLSDRHLGYVLWRSCGRSAIGRTLFVLPRRRIGSKPLRAPGLQRGTECPSSPFQLIGRRANSTIFVYPHMAIYRCACRREEVLDKS